MTPTAQILQSLEEDIRIREALGQDVTTRKALLNKLKPKTLPTDPIWQALGGAPDQWPGKTQEQVIL